MINPKQNIRIFLWTIPILTLSGLIVLNESRLNTCSGLVHAVGDIFPLLFLFLFLAIFLGRQLFKVVSTNENRNTRIWASLLVISAVVIAIQGKSAWKEFRPGKSLVKASIYPDQLDIGQIHLLDNQIYYAQYGHIDWSCAIKDHYKLVGDTLYLAGQPNAKSDGIIADKYIINDSTWEPINETNQEKHQTQTMFLEP